MVPMRAGVLVLASVAAFGLGCGQAMPPLPLHIGGDLKAPRVLESAEPELPEGLEGKSRTVNAQIYLWVDEKGMPSHVKVVKSSAPELDDMWIATVQKYRFAPATLDGKPVTVDMYMQTFVDGF